MNSSQTATNIILALNNPQPQVSKVDTPERSSSEKSFNEVFRDQNRTAGKDKSDSSSRDRDDFSNNRNERSTSPKNTDSKDKREVGSEESQPNRPEENKDRSKTDNNGNHDKAATDRPASEDKRSDNKVEAKQGDETQANTAATAVKQNDTAAVDDSGESVVSPTVASLVQADWIAMIRDARSIESGNNLPPGTLPLVNGALNNGSAASSNALLSTDVPADVRAHISDTLNNGAQSKTQVMPGAVTSAATLSTANQPLTEAAAMLDEKTVNTAKTGPSTAGVKSEEIDTQLKTSAELEAANANKVSPTTGDTPSGTGKSNNPTLNRVSESEQKGLSEFLGKSEDRSSTASQPSARGEVGKLLTDTVMSAVDGRAINQAASATVALRSAETKAPVSDSVTEKLAATPASDGKWAQSLTQIQHNQSGLSAKPFTLQNTVPFANTNTQWANSMAEKVMWLAGQRIQSAEIQLDPPELGPIQVRIAVNHDQASVNFVSQHVSVREALDSSVMRLREMFAEEGMNLVNVDVSDRSGQEFDGQGSDDNHANDSSNPLAQVDGQETHSTSSATVEITNLVDYYV